MECVLNRPTCKRTIMDRKGPFIKEVCPLSVKPKCMFKTKQCPLLPEENTCVIDKLMGIIQSGGCFPPQKPKPKCGCCCCPCDKEPPDIPIADCRMNNVVQMPPCTRCRLGFEPKTSDPDPKKSEPSKPKKVSPKIEKLPEKRNKTVPDCTLSSRRPFPCSECLINLLDCPLNSVDYDSSKVYCKARAVQCPFTQVIDICEAECLCVNVPEVDTGPRCPFLPEPCPCRGPPTCPMTSIACNPLIEHIIPQCPKPHCRCFCPLIPNPCSFTPPECPIHCGKITCPLTQNKICPSMFPPICLCPPPKKKKTKKEKAKPPKVEIEVEVEVEHGVRKESKEDKKSGPERESINPKRKISPINKQSEQNVTKRKKHMDNVKFTDKNYSLLPPSQEIYQKSSPKQQSSRIFKTSKRYKDNKHRVRIYPSIRTESLYKKGDFSKVNKKEQSKLLPPATTYKSELFVKKIEAPKFCKSPIESVKCSCKFGINDRGPKLFCFAERMQEMLRNFRCYEFEPCQMSGKETICGCGDQCKFKFPEVERTFHVPTCPQSRPLPQPKSPEKNQVCPFAPNECPLGPYCWFPITPQFDPDAPPIPKNDAVCFCKRECCLKTSPIPCPLDMICHPNPCSCVLPPVFKQCPFYTFNPPPRREPIVRLCKCCKKSEPKIKRPKPIRICVPPPVQNYPVPNVASLPQSITRFLTPDPKELDIQCPLSKLNSLCLCEYNEKYMKANYEEYTRKCCPCIEKPKITCPLGVKDCPCLNLTMTSACPLNAIQCPFERPVCPIPPELKTEKKIQDEKKEPEVKTSDIKSEDVKTPPILKEESHAKTQPIRKEEPHINIEPLSTEGSHTTVTSTGKFVSFYNSKNGVKEKMPKQLEEDTKVLFDNKRLNKINDKRQLQFKENIDKVVSEVKPVEINLPKPDLDQSNNKNKMHHDPIRISYTDEKLSIENADQSTILRNPNPKCKPVSNPPRCMLAKPKCPMKGAMPAVFHENEKPKAGGGECPISIPPCDLFPKGKCPMEEMGACTCNYPVAPCLAAAQCGYVVASPQYCYKEDCCMGLTLPPTYPAGHGKYDTGFYYKFMDWKPGEKATKHYIAASEEPPVMDFFHGHEKRVHDNWWIIRAGKGYEECKKVKEILEKRGPVDHRGTQFDAGDNPIDLETKTVIENRKYREEQKARMENSPPWKQ